MVTDLHEEHGPALAAIALDLEVTRQQLGDADRNGSGDKDALAQRMTSLERSVAVLRRSMGDA